MCLVAVFLGIGWGSHKITEITSRWQESVDDHIRCKQSRSASNHNEVDRNIKTVPKRAIKPKMVANPNAVAELKIARNKKKLRKMEVFYDDYQCDETEEYSGILMSASPCVTLQKLPVLTTECDIKEEWNKAVEKERKKQKYTWGEVASYGATELLNDCHAFAIGADGNILIAHDFVLHLTSAHSNTETGFYISPHELKLFLMGIDEYGEDYSMRDAVVDHLDRHFLSMSELPESTLERITLDKMIKWGAVIPEIKCKVHSDKTNEFRTADCTHRWFTMVQVVSEYNKYVEAGGTLPPDVDEKELENFFAKFDRKKKKHPRRRNKK